MQREADKEGNKIKNQNTKFENNAMIGKSIESLLNKFNVKVLSTKKQKREWRFLMEQYPIYIGNQFNKPIYVEISI